MKMLLPPQPPPSRLCNFFFLHNNTRRMVAMTHALICGSLDRFKGHHISAVLRDWEKKRIRKKMGIIAVWHLHHPLSSAGYGATNERNLTHADRPNE
jgi:hypothetical protein